MPIVPPVLDDRRFNDLVSELVARIPAHTPEWTNPMLGDPGRTVIDLFAWLTDTLLYRANLIPERQRLAFLRLLGVQMKPAVAARCLISISIDDDKATDAVAIKPRTGLDKPVRFETGSELTVMPVTAAAYYKRPLLEAELNQVEDVLDDLKDVYTDVGDKLPTPYATTAVYASGQPEESGFDPSAEALDGCLWIALLAASDDELHLSKVINTLGGNDQEQVVLNVGIVPNIEVPDLSADIGTRAKIPHTWEMTTNRETSDGLPEYVTLEPIDAADSTHGLTQRGIQRLLLPSASQIGAPTNDVRKNLQAGVGDRPPRLDDADQAARLIAWIRLRTTQEGAGVCLSWVGINAVEVDQRRTITYSQVGQSDGQPDQTLTLPGQGIEEESFELEVEEENRGFVVWQSMSDLALAGRDDYVYRLDSEAGTISFGDGVRGRIPTRGARVRVVTMRYGGGSAGNVAAGSIDGIKTSNGGDAGEAKLKVFQPLAASGGEDAETLSEAEKRIPSLLRNRDRAITPDDYEQIAADTPGVSLGRVEVMPHFKPHQRLTEVPGVVSVMVLPQKTTHRSPNPRPDRSVLESVYAYLDERRPIGTELYVIGCAYVPLGISTNITIADGYGRETVLHNVRESIYDYLWPLTPGGPLGTGWPLGRAVSDRELEVVISRTEGVEGVNGVNLFQQVDLEQSGVTPCKKKTVQPEWKLVTRKNCQPVEIEMKEWELPELMAVHAVTTDDEAVNASDGAPSELTIPRGSDAAAGVAVPVVPEVCQ